jgi:hypothetical protein
MCDCGAGSGLTRCRTLNRTPQPIRDWRLAPETLQQLPEPKDHARCAA